MAARARIVVAAGLAVLVLAALVAATSDGARFGGLDLRREPTSQATEDERGPDRAADEERSGGAPPPAPPRSGTEDLSRLVTLLIVLVVLAVCLVVIVSFRLALRRRRLRGDRPVRAGPPPIAVEVPIEDESLGEVLEDRLAAVGEGSPRNAIVAAWVRLEEFAAAQGLRRQPADTPAEFVARALASYSLDAAALDRLADLYREARFSEHPITERHRDDARECLARLVGERTGGAAR